MMEPHRKKNARRPTKGGGAKRRRMIVQRRRLVALGMAEDKVAALNAKQLRMLLRRPARIAPKKK